jgi:hypothetical protein
MGESETSRGQIRERQAETKIEKALKRESERAREWER